MRSSIKTFVSGILAMCMLLELSECSICVDRRQCTS